jgi:hypothetical protein
LSDIHEGGYRTFSCLFLPIFPTWLGMAILDLFGAVLRVRIQSEKPDSDRIRVKSRIRIRISEISDPHWREKPDPDLHES